MQTIKTQHLTTISGGHIRYEIVLSLTNGSTFDIIDDGLHTFYSQDACIIDGISYPEVFSSGITIDDMNIVARPIENGVAYYGIIANY